MTHTVAVRGTDKGNAVCAALGATPMTSEIEAKVHLTARQSSLSPSFAWPGCGASRQRGMLSRSRPSPEKIFALLEPCLDEAPGVLDCARVPKFREGIQDEG